MNDAISQQMPLFDAGATTRQVERNLQQKRVAALNESDRTNARKQDQAQPDSRSGGAEALAEKIDQLNLQMQDMRRSLRFSVDDSSGRIVVKVVDLSTDEVIRQIPSEEMMSLIKNASEGDSLIFSGEA